MLGPRRRSAIVTLMAVVLALLAGVSWALASPVGASPDDDFHQASIWCPRPGDASGCTVRRDESGGIHAVEVPNVIARSAACFAFHDEISGACTQQIPDGVTWTDHFNRGEYPGVFYRVMHVFVGPDVERSIVMMRMANVLLTVVLLGGILVVAAPRQRRMIGLALLAPMVPLGIYLSASINPSGWSFVGVSTAAAGLLISADVPSIRRSVLATAIATLGAVIAVSARGDAGPFLCVTAAAIALATVRWSRRWLITRGPGFLLVASIGLVSYLTSRQAALLSETPQAAVENPRQLLFNNLLELPSLFIGMFGSWALGWTDNPMPAMVWSLSLFAALVVVVVGVSSMNVAKFAALLVVGTVMVVLPLVLYQRLGASVGSWVQPRYLLPLAPVFLLLMAYDPNRRAAVRLTLAQTLMTATAAGVANAVALYSTLRRYLTGLDGPTVIGRNVEWWWATLPGPRVVFVAGALSFVVVAFVLLLGEGTVLRRALPRTFAPNPGPEQVPGPSAQPLTSSARDASCAD